MKQESQPQSNCTLEKGVVYDVAKQGIFLNLNVGWYVCSRLVSAGAGSAFLRWVTHEERT